MQRSRGGRTRTWALLLAAGWCAWVPVRPADASTCRRCPESRGPESAGIPARRPLDGEYGPVRGPEGPGTDRRRAEKHPYEPRRVPCPEVVRLAQEIAPKYALEPALLAAVARVESGFVANVLSPVAAVGLSQVMPLVAARLGCGDLFQPRDNLECGARVLQGFLRSFDGDLVAALSGYNAGYGMPTSARKEQRPPANFQYVEDVLRARSRLVRSGCRAWEAGPGGARRH
ncbi:lytic transglycosylase domain-containing protein [Myxococcota bacterium]|nr:lytic transglycosylase domain-containing protein [Myxococcota bacterium]